MAAVTEVPRLRLRGLLGGKVFDVKLAGLEALGNDFVGQFGPGNDDVRSAPVLISGQNAPWRSN